MKGSVTMHRIATHIGLLLLGAISTVLTIWIIDILIHSYSQTDISFFQDYRIGITGIIFSVWYGTWFTGRFPYYRRTYRRTAGIISMHGLLWYWLVSIQEIHTTSAYILLGASMIGWLLWLSPIKQQWKNRLILLDIACIALFVLLESIPHYPHTIQGERWRARQPSFVVAYYDAISPLRPQDGTIVLSTQRGGEHTRQKRSYSREDIHNNPQGLTINDRLVEVEFIHPNSNEIQTIGIISPGGQRHTLQPQERILMDNATTDYYNSQEQTKEIPEQRRMLYSQGLYAIVAETLARPTGDSSIGRNAARIKMQLYSFLGNKNMQRALDNMYVYYRLRDGEPLPSRLENHPLAKLPRSLHSIQTENRSNINDAESNALLWDQLQRGRNSRK